MYIYNRICLSLLLGGAVFPAAAQFAPQAGIAGSTAIPASDQRFVSWATGCAVQRGYLDIAHPSDGRALAGADSLAAGAADNQIVSLGDSGVAVLTFAAPVINGPGADFAVFENGFGNPADPEEAFLELAFVEVSSDGVRYVRFPAISHTQDTLQIAGAGMYMNARAIHNLAGKYRSGYGTPFDLDELADTPGLDINRITHIRIVDVIGAVSSYGATDHEGHVINDPYPTPYPVGTGGFDLDAVGVIHQENTGIAAAAAEQAFRIYPNPAADYLHIRTAGRGSGAAAVRLTDITGKVLATHYLHDGRADIPVAPYAPGVYYLLITDTTTGTQWAERISRR